MEKGADPFYGTKEDIAKAVIFGAIIGGVFGGFGPTVVGPMRSTFMNHVGAGMGGDAAGQLATMRDGQDYNYMQTLTQGGVGGAGGLAGRAAAWRISRNVVRGGKGAERAIAVGGGIGGAISTGTVAGANIAIPGDFGGMNTPTDCEC